MALVDDVGYDPACKLTEQLRDRENGVKSTYFRR